MGRQLRRVALDFNWPLNKVWKGFLNPHPGPKTCTACNGEGMNPATAQVHDDFYDSAGRGTRWRDNITQDEVDALVQHGRLYDFTHTWTREKGWQRDPAKPHPTAAQVNAANGPGALFLSGHDGINRMILVETRAKRLGVYGKCETCGGSGEQKQPRKAKKRYTHWKDFEPPAGPGYQVWETVSEGSPVTPVFADPEDLVAYLVVDGVSQAAASRFVHGDGWVPSMVMTAGQLYVGIEALTAKGMRA